ncbi:MAG: GNAT family N-acetyltransferase [Candidatus Aminicenantales bacterium]
MADDYSIETFRGDYDALERMAHASWKDEYGEASFPNFYRPAFIRYLIERIPAEKRDHVLAAYRGDRIIAFFANLPQKFSFRGKLLRAAYSCLLVTGKEDLRRGVAAAVIRRALEIARQHGYDFSLFTLETGHRSTKMMAKMKEEGRMEWVRKTGVLGRVLDLPRAAYSERLKGYEIAALRLIGAQRPPRRKGLLPLREYRPSDLDGCLALLDGYKNSLRLALVWDREDLARELEYPDVSRTLVYEKDGRITGLINFILHDHLGRNVERWAWINHVAFPGLSNAERTAFIRSYLVAMQDAGFIGTVEWKRRNYPARVLYRNRFFPYPRGVNQMSWTFNPDLSLANIPDVYEVQI